MIQITRPIGDKPLSLKIRQSLYEIFGIHTVPNLIIMLILRTSVPSMQFRRNLRHQPTPQFSISASQYSGPVALKFIHALITELAVFCPSIFSPAVLYENPYWFIISNADPYVGEVCESNRFSHIFGLHLSQLIQLTVQGQVSKACLTSLAVNDAQNLRSF